MTNEMLSLRTLVEKTPDADILREMISFAAGRLMELEVGAMTGAAYGQKDPSRQPAPASGEFAVCFSCHMYKFDLCGNCYNL